MGYKLTAVGPVDAISTLFIGQPTVEMNTVVCGFYLSFL